VCTACVDEIGEGGAQAKVMQMTHKLSLGLVDGRPHKAPGRRITDRAPRANETDNIAVARRMTYFRDRFRLAQQTYRDLWDVALEVGVEMDVLSSCDVAFRSLHHYNPHHNPLPPHCSTDFITTIRHPPCTHVPLRAKPNPCKNDVRPKNTFSDAPYLTQHYNLKYSSTKRNQHYITSMPLTQLIRSTRSGTVLWHEGVVVAGMPPERLDRQTTENIRYCFLELSKLGGFVQRGDGAASICVNYLGVGLKCDQNTRLCMPHSLGHLEDADALRVMNANLKMAAIFKNIILPIVEKYFGVLTLGLRHALEVDGLHLWGTIVTGANLGHLFWPRHHRDGGDFGYTILTPIDLGFGVNRGGDFAFGDVGWVLEVKHGDIIIANSMYGHSTTEFDVGSSRDGRFYVSWYLKHDGLESHIRSSVMSQRHRMPLAIP
jgi:hypothetical protein